MSHLALFLFGPPHMERDGQTVNTDTRKAVALIAYLAVTRQRYTRDALAALLWPDYDQPHARATLRRTLSALNKALGGRWLSVDRETVSLDQQASFWLDVDEFHKFLAECRTHKHAPSETCPSCLGPLTRAATLYRDDFMAGFNLNDSENFDDWQFFQSDSLRREFSSVLERLVICHSTLADFETAITYARRWLTIDRLHEPVHRYLMQLYAWIGQRAAAMHQYQECVQILDQELGVAPLEATTQLFEAIKENKAPPPPTQPRSSITLQAVHTPSQIASWDTSDTATTSSTSTISYISYPLVGRLDEWSALLRTYTDTNTHGHVAILEGEAGIGKTRLGEEFLSYARSRGTTVITARCYEGETNFAYGPIVAGLRTAIVQKDGTSWLKQIPPHWISEAARLLPELNTLYPGLPPAPPLDSPGAQGRFFEGLRQVLIAICSNSQQTRQQPGILFIDDVHWIDVASLDLLSYLIRRLQERPIYLLLNWRTEQAAHVHHLQRILAEAQRTGSATILSLPRLNQSTIQTLIQAATSTGVTPPHTLVERLYQETEGLPLFLTEYLTAMAQGTLQIEDKDWLLPGGVRDLLASRLAAIGSASWQILSTAAIIGRSFDFDTLRETSGRSEEETVTALEDLINQGLVQEMAAATMNTMGRLHIGQSQQSEPILMYDFSHEKLRSLAYEETSQARRRLLHRRIAEVLVTRIRGQRASSTLAGQIGYHYQMAGQKATAAEYYVQAGERARTLYAYTEALAHFRSALELGHPDVARLHETLGDLHTFLGEYLAALKSYNTAAHLDSPPTLATVEHKLGQVHGRRGAWEKAEDYFEKALHTLGDTDNTGPADVRSKIYADWSLAITHRQNIPYASQLAHRALELAEIAHDTKALAQAHNMLGILAHRLLDLEKAHYHLEQSLELTANLNAPGIRAAALNNLALVCQVSGATAKAIELAQAALELCISEGDRHHEAALHSNLADLYHAAGRPEDSMTHLKRAVSIYSEIGVEAGTVQPEIWRLAEW